MHKFGLIYTFEIFVSEISNFTSFRSQTPIFNSNIDFDILMHVLEKDTALAIKWFNNNYMNANAEKFQWMIMNRKGSISSPLSINNIILSSVDCLNVLGITLDAKLKFDDYISKISKKASQQVNILQRLSKYLSFESRLLAYNSFVTSNFKYCPVAWMLR